MNKIFTFLFTRSQCLGHRVELLSSFPPWYCHGCQSPWIHKSWCYGDRTASLSHCRWWCSFSQSCAFCWSQRFPSEWKRKSHGRVVTARAQLLKRFNNCQLNCVELDKFWPTESMECLMENMPYGEAFRGSKVDLLTLWPLTPNIWETARSIRGCVDQMRPLIVLTNIPA